MTIALTVQPDFNVAQPGTTLFSKLSCPRPDPDRSIGIQSFAFDEVNRRIYCLMSFDGPKGDLYLAWLDERTGARNSEFMTLYGFGHGQALGVQVVGSTTYIWMECDQKLNVNGNAYGTKICRFAWKAGTTLTSTTSSGITKFDLRPGSEINMCSVDNNTDRIMHRWVIDGKRYIAVYYLPDLLAKGTSATPLAPPLEQVPMAGLTSQGLTYFGDFAYFIAGDGKNPICAAAPPVRLFWQNVWNGQSGSAQNNTALDIPRREPEGVAIQTVNGNHRLVWSFATRADCTSGTTLISMFYIPSGNDISPPPTVVRSVNGYGGPLGCGTYRVYVYDRGGQDRMGEITPISQLAWARVRDDISLATIDTAGFGPDCCELLSEIRSMRHEMVIYRDGVRVWEGPITRVAFSFDSVEVEARDVMHYLHRRILREGYNHSYDTKNKKSRSQHVTNTIESIIKTTLSPNFTPIPDDPHEPVEWAGGHDPNILKYLTVYKYSDDAREARHVYPFQKTLWEEIDDLAANAGVDYTTVGRRIIVWDTSRAIGKTQVLTDADFMANPVVTEYGMSLATFAAVTDGKGFYGVAGGTDAYYGLVEILASSFSESTAPEKTAVTTYTNLMKLQTTYYERKHEYERYNCLSAAEEAQLAAMYKERGTPGVTPERQKVLDARIKPLADRVTGCHTLQTRMNNAKKAWDDAKKKNSDYEKKITDYIQGLTSQAQRNLKPSLQTIDGRQRPVAPLSVRIPENTQLNPEVNLGIQDLVPGIWIPLRSGDTCRSVQQWQKLDAVNVSIQDGVEQVQITVSPAPQSGADPDADQNPPDE